VVVVVVVVVVVIDNNDAEKAHVLNITNIGDIKILSIDPEKI